MWSKRAVKPWVLTATTVLVACRTPAPTPTPQDRAAILAAVRATNGVWEPVEAHRIHGLSFEHYRRADGPTLLLVLDDRAASSTAAPDVVTHQVWIELGARDDDRPGRAAATIAATRPPDVVPGRHAAAVSWHAAYWRTTTTPEHLDAVVRASAASKVVLPKAPPSPPWTSARLGNAFERAATQTAVDDFERRAGAALTPSNRTVVLAGAIDRLGALAAIAEAYPPSEPRGPARAVPEAPPSSAPVELEVPGSIHRGFLWWPLRSASPRDELAAEMTASVLSRRVLARARARTIQAVEVRHRPGRSGALTIDLELAETFTATAAAAVVQDALQSMASGETTGIEIERANARVEGARWRSLSSLEDRAALAGRALIEHGSLGPLAEKMALMGTLDERDVRRIAARLRSRPPIVVVGRTARTTP